MDMDSNTTDDFRHNPSAFTTAPPAQPPTYSQLLIHSDPSQSLLPNHSHNDPNPPPPYIQRHNALASANPISHSQVKTTFLQRQRPVQPQPQQQLDSRLYPPPRQIANFISSSSLPRVPRPLVQQFQPPTMRPQPTLIRYPIVQQQTPLSALPGSSILIPDTDLSQQLGLQPGYGLSWDLVNRRFAAGPWRR